MKRLLRIHPVAAVLAALFLTSIANATPTFRSAIPMGTASSWSAGVGSDANAIRGLWFNTGEHALVHTNTGGAGTDWQVDTVYSVIAFGADPTGVADSTTAIQNALNAAAGKGAVFLPAGVYHISSTITIPDHTQMWGAGIGNNTDEQGTIIYRTANNIGFQAVGVSTPGVHLSRIHIKDIKFEDTGQASDYFLFKYVSQLWMERVYIYNTQGIALDLQGVFDSRFDNIEMDWVGNSSGSLPGIQILGNGVSGITDTTNELMFFQCRFENYRGTMLYTNAGGLDGNNKIYFQSCKFESLNQPNSVTPIIFNYVSALRLDAVDVVTSGPNGNTIPQQILINQCTAVRGSLFLTHGSGGAAQATLTQFMTVQNSNKVMLDVQQFNNVDFFNAFGDYGAITASQLINVSSCDYCTFSGYPTNHSGTWTKELSNQTVTLSPTGVDTYLQGLASPSSGNFQNSPKLVLRGTYNPSGTQNNSDISIWNSTTNSAGFKQLMFTIAGTNSVAIQQGAVVIPVSDNVGASGVSGNAWNESFSYWYGTQKGSALASASTITPTSGLHHVTGTTTISTIATSNLPSSFTGKLTLIFDGAAPIATGGNIATAFTPVAGKAYDFHWDGSTWTPEGDLGTSVSPAQSFLSNATLQAAASSSGNFTNSPSLVFNGTSNSGAGSVNDSISIFNNVTTSGGFQQLQIAFNGTNKLTIQQGGIFVPTTTNTAAVGIAGNAFAQEWAEWHGTPLGSALTSAATITPTQGFHHVTGTVSVTTIATTNLPSSFAGLLSLVCDAACVFATGGNINTGFTGTAGKVYQFWYSTTDTKWYVLGGG